MGNGKLGSWEVGKMGSRVDRGRRIGVHATRLLLIGLKHLFVRLFYCGADAAMSELKMHLDGSVPTNTTPARGTPTIETNLSWIQLVSQFFSNIQEIWLSSSLQREKFY